MVFCQPKYCLKYKKKRKIKKLKRQSTVAKEIRKNVREKMKKFKKTIDKK